MLLDIESIIESAVDEASGRFLERLIDAVFNNLPYILGGIAIFALIIVALLWRAKRKLENSIRVGVETRFREKEAQLSRLMTHALFQELESGLVQGKTGEVLGRLETRMVATHREGQELARNLDPTRKSRQGLVGTWLLLRRLREDVGVFGRHVDRLAAELTELEQLTSGSVGQLQPIRQQLYEAEGRLQALSDRTGYALERLSQRREQAQEAVRTAGEAYSFDVLQAPAALHRAQGSVTALQEGVVRLEEDIRIYGEMKKRVEAWKALRSDNTGRIAQVRQVLEQLERRLARGEETDLRGAAVELEALMGQLE